MDTTTKNAPIKMKFDAIKLYPGAVMQLQDMIGDSDIHNRMGARRFHLLLLIQTFLKYSDIALYQAKERGRDQTVMFSAEMWKEKDQY